MQAGLRRNLRPRLVDGSRVETEAGDEQERGRQQEDEQPVRERAREKPTADLGVVRG